MTRRSHSRPGNMRVKTPFVNIGLSWEFSVRLAGNSNSNNCSKLIKVSLIPVSEVKQFSKKSISIHFVNEKNASVSAEAQNNAKTSSDSKWAGILDVLEVSQRKNPALTSYRSWTLCGCYWSYLFWTTLLLFLVLVPTSMQTYLSSIMCLESL